MECRSSESVEPFRCTHPADLETVIELSSECETDRVTRTIRMMKRMEFSADDPSEILNYMDLLSDTRDGWINLTPATDSKEGRASLGFLALFGGGSSGMTMCTWIPEPEDPHGGRQVSLGITHTTGRRVRTQLSSLAIPAHWEVKQDHPQRGLVLHVPDDEPNERVLSWALRVLRALSPPADLTIWRADVYLPADS